MTLAEVRDVFVQAMGSTPFTAGEDAGAMFDEAVQAHDSVTNDGRTIPC